MLDKNHYLYKKFMNFLKLSKINLIWYLKNKDKINFIDEYIYLDGIYLELNDFIVDVNNIDIWDKDGKRYFTYDSSIRETSIINKKIPSKKDWENIINFLPGDTDNKLYFLLNILGLSYSGFKCRDNGFYCNYGFDGGYWSSDSTITHAYNLHINSNLINPNDLEFKNIGFLVRCIK